METQFDADPMAFEQIGNSRFYHDLMQGTDEWLELRLGLMTASEMKLVLTDTLKISNNEKTRAHTYELAAQRINKRITHGYESYDMRRGKVEEERARAEYSDLYAPVEECGFVTSNDLGFTLGMSPDGLVGDDGIIEVKSRAAKYQMQTILEHIVAPDALQIPKEFMLQVQASLQITGRKWCDFISYSNGMNMVVIRVEPIQEYQDKIIEAATLFEKSVQHHVSKYTEALADPENRITATEWREYHDDIIA